MLGYVRGRGERMCHQGMYCLSKSNARSFPNQCKKKRINYVKHIFLRMICSLISGTNNDGRKAWNKMPHSPANLILQKELCLLEKNLYGIYVFAN